MNRDIVPLNDLSVPLFCSKLSTDITIKASHKDYFPQMKNLARHSMIYLNTSGGLVQVNFTRGYTRKHADEWECKVKQFLCTFISDGTYRKCITITIDNAKDVAEIHVMKADCLVTFQSNLYTRVGSSCEEIKYQNEIWQEINESSHVSTRPSHSRIWSGLDYGLVIKEDESEDLEFKCYQVSGVSDLTKKITADTIKSRDICLFERVLLGLPQLKHGGKVIVGVREDARGNKIICGQVLGEHEQELFTHFIDQLLRESPSGVRRIWGDPNHRPQQGQDWDIKFHSICKTPRNERRVLIEININHMPGGVFAAMPQSMVHNSDGTVSALSFMDWKNRLDYMHDLSSIRDMISAELPLERDTGVSKYVASAQKPGEHLSQDIDEALLLKLTTDLKDHHRSQLPHKESHQFSWTSGSDYWLRETGVFQNMSKADLISLAEARMLKPECPMTVTPEQNILVNTLRNVAGGISDAFLYIAKYHSEAKAAAVGCKQIVDLFPDIAGPSTPVDHVADKLVLTEEAAIHLWTISRSAMHLPNQKQYLFDAMRRLKMLILQMAQKICQRLGVFVSNISITGHIYCLDTGQSELDTIEQMPKVDRPPLKALQMTLAALLLIGETLVRDRLGDELLICLTKDQVETLAMSSMAQVSVIQGPPGSGKTVMAMYLCDKMLKQRKLEKEQIQYMCPNEALAAYVRSQDRCQVQSILSGDKMLLAVGKALKKGVKCFILDDVQVLDIKRKHWKKLFALLEIPDNYEVCMFLFIDSVYQNFMSISANKLDMAIAEYITDHPFFSCYRAPTLNEMLRNTRKVYSYFRANVGKHQSNVKLVCCHGVIGDDITVLHCQEFFTKHENNPVLQVTAQLLQNTSASGHVYQRHDIAILVDADGKGHADGEVKKLLDIFHQHLPDLNAQRATVVPVQGVVVEELCNYSGLDAKACICVLASKSQSAISQLDNYKYKLFVASRGIYRVTFLVRGNVRSDVLQQMKFSEEMLWQQVTIQYSG